MKSLSFGGKIAEVRAGKVVLTADFQEFLYVIAERSVGRSSILYVVIEDKPGKFVSIS